MTQSRRFGRPRLSQKSLSYTLKKPAFKGRRFQTLRAPTGSPPYRLDLKDVAPGDLYKAIVRGKRMVFHTPGDFAGLQLAAPRKIVADDLQGEFDPHATIPPNTTPSLFV